MTELTRERLRELLDYDPETGLFVRRVPTRRGARFAAGTKAGCVRSNDGYLCIRIDGRLYLAHRLAWLHMTGEWPADLLDHKDRDRANNRWANLRLATGNQNGMNKARQSNNKSGFKGVHWQPGLNKWRARIKASGRHLHLGCFDDPEVAYAAYRDAAVRHFGEFAGL